MKTTPSRPQNKNNSELISLENKVLQLEQENQSLLLKIQELHESKMAADTRYQRLLEQIQLARRQRFGASSEKVSPS